MNRPWPGNTFSPFLMAKGKDLFAGQIPVQSFDPSILNNKEDPGKTRVLRCCRRICKRLMPFTVAVATLYIVVPDARYNLLVPGDPGTCFPVAGHN